MVEHNTKNENKKYYKRIQEIIQEFKPRVNACRDADGKILTGKEDIQRRWQEYFDSVLTGNTYDVDSMTFFTAENEDIQPSYEEVTHIIKRLKNHKVPRTDQILAEFLKKGGEPLWRRIHHLIKLIWTQNTGRMDYGNYTTHTQESGQIRMFQLYSHNITQHHLQSTIRYPIK